MSVQGKLRVMVAGGGTGGHLFPGLAIAEEFMAHDAARVLFVGTGRPVEARVLDPLGLAHERLSITGLVGKPLLARLGALMRLPGSLFAAWRLIHRFKPDLIVAVGGYSAGPLGLVGWLTGRPVVLHEQNSVPGLTNKILARLARLVFISFEMSRPYFPAGRTILTGNPVRQGLIEQARAARPPEGPPTLLVLGGSLGAHAVNLAVIQAVAELRSQGLEFGLIHQTGEADLEMVRAAYAQMGQEAECQAFIKDMAAAYARAHLAVCRAGALSVTELALFGLPAIFIPLPGAAGDHQTHNAAWLVERGGALAFRQDQLTNGRLAEAVKEMLVQPQRLAAMRRALAGAANPRAASQIRARCLPLMKKRGKAKKEA